MVEYAEVKAKNDGSGDYTVRGVFTQPFLPEFEPLSGLLAVDVSNMTDKPQPGDIYHPDTDTFDVSPPPPSYTLDVLVDGNANEVTVTPGTSVTIDVMALKDGSTTTDFDGNTHYVPILDVDGTKATLLKTTLQDGTASATFTPSDAGIFTVDTEKIYPHVTKASIPNKPVVIAE